jgi:rhamnosyl/mannosyltransferase
VDELHEKDRSESNAEGFSLKVLQVAHYYRPLGGIERIVYQFSQGLKDLYEVEVLVSNTTWQTTQVVEEGIPVTRVGRMVHFARMSLCPSFPIWLRRMKPDLVHLHMPNPMAELSFLLSGLNCPLIATYHMDVTRQKVLNSLYGPLRDSFMQRVTFLTASSENIARTSPVLSKYPDKVRVLPFGLSKSALPESEVSVHLTQQIRATYSSPIVLFVGRLIHYKGLDVLLAAMREIDAICLIVGEGYLRESLQTQINRFDLARKVHLLGRISDEQLVAYYDAADVFVMPSNSRTEAFGLSQVEAMSRGVPVVCCEIGTGTTFVNLEGVSGLVVPPNQPTHLAKAIKAILSDTELRCRLAQGARDRAMNLFTEEKMIENLRLLYKEIFT